MEPFKIFCKTQLGLKLGKIFLVLGEDKEWLAKYSRKKLQEKHRDYFIFGHRHLPMQIDLNENSKYINLGDWINHYTYGVFDGNKFETKKWKI